MHSECMINSIICINLITVPALFHPDAPRSNAMLCVPIPRYQPCEPRCPEFHEIETRRREADGIAVRNVQGPIGAGNWWVQFGMRTRVEDGSRMLALASPERLLDPSTTMRCELAGDPEGPGSQIRPTRKAFLLLTLVQIILQDLHQTHESMISASRSWIRLIIMACWLTTSLSAARSVWISLGRLAEGHWSREEEVWT
jgi:hypothetical protein